ncbi:MAG TPA: HNH endonuclease [Terriglobales bacterium]|nr:HNH endonuclease [Terriglobales bacterium]
MKPRWVERKMQEHRRRKVKIYRRDAGACRYCGVVLDFAAATLDHIVPVSRGGTNAEANLVLACAPCNNAKADNSAAWYEARRIAELERERTMRGACLEDDHVIRELERQADIAVRSRYRLLHALRALVKHVQRTDTGHANRPAMKHAVAVLDRERW